MASSCAGRFAEPLAWRIPELHSLDATLPPAARVSADAVVDGTKPARSAMHGRMKFTAAIVGALGLLASAGVAANAAVPFADLKSARAFLDEHCIRCHGEKKAKGDVTLHTFTDAKSFLKERKLWETALRMVENGEMPPEKEPRPGGGENSAFVKSVRAVFETADAGKPDPGRVPIRRLNRTEYANTVRELLQLDLALSPESDLPTDAVTHGFDNIADALTISPVLLDRYLASAEMIAERAIRAEFPKRELLTEGSLAPGLGGATKDVPVAKVLETMTALADANPKDALVRYRLARTHAEAYSRKSGTVKVIPGKESEGVWFGLNSGHLPFEVSRVDDPAKLKTASEHLERATARYREVLRIEPENLSARLGQAWCALQSGDRTTAIAEFRAVIDAAWVKERELRPVDWKAPSIVLEASSHLSSLLDKKEDAKEIASLNERTGQLRKTVGSSPWRPYRLLDSGANEPGFTGPFYVRKEGNNVGIEPLLKYASTDEFLFRVTLFVEKSSEPVRVALFVGGPGLPEYSTDDERGQLLGEIRDRTPLKILKIVEVTARLIDAPQQIEALISRRGRSGPIGIMGIGLIKPKNGSSPVRMHFKLEAEGPLPPLSHQHILACSADKPQAEQTREIVGRMLPKAFRRPVTKDEIEAIAKFADRAVADGQKWEVGMQHALIAMLCSPKFLFRAELDDRPDSAESHPTGEFELASRLSYFLWSGMPDDELFKLAGEKKLSANLEAQVRRMLKDPKSIALVDNFATQWLNLSQLQTHAPDAKLFPKFDKELREAMLGESRAFLHHLIREERSLLDLIDSDYTFMNGRLGQHYGVADTLGNRPGPNPAIKGGSPIPGNGFVRVQLQGTERGGLLTHASILTMTSPTTRTSPVKRGAWVLEKILGTPPPPPPPNVPELDPKEVTATNLRERLQQHRANAACASCHSKVDPLGFAFENYDAIGAFRMKDGNQDIDASGTLPDGRKFSGMGDLKKSLLADKERFARNVTEKLLTYALGRGVEYYDKRAIDRIVSEVAKDDFKFSRMVIATVQSDPFRLRRGKDQTQ